MKAKKPKIIAVSPAYNVEGSLERFFNDFPFKVFDEVILVDNASSDSTYKMARGTKGVRVFRNSRNLGYGGNMKRCLDLALKAGADIVVEIHPDGEYGFDGILPAIAEIKKGAGLVLGNRFYKRFSGIRSGMYFWKIPFSRALTWIGNLVLGTNIPDLHQGFRVYSRELLEKVDYHAFSNDFLFTFEVIVEAVTNRFRIRSVPVTGRYIGKKRGADFKSSLMYTVQTLGLLFRYRMGN